MRGPICLWTSPKPIPPYCLLVLCLSQNTLKKEAQLHGGFSTENILVSAKLIFIAVFWFMANPTAMHALLRAAFDAEIVPWTKDGKPIIEWPPRKEDT